MKFRLIAAIVLSLSVTACGNDNYSTCATLASGCIDIFDAGSGKLFTNSPSVAYLDSIGGSPAYSTWAVDGTRGPSGRFYLFDWNNAKSLCDTYNSHSLGGRTNWRLPARDELMGLFYSFGNMFIARGWPTDGTYWSITADDSNYYDVDLGTGSVSTTEPNSKNDHPLLYSTFTTHASCISNP
ncbi:hypothetical protein TUM4438_10810 [Shewanella sairae]|uniref:Lcl C-terminal domain-containing protein n=1 Tax=Shewanella sairae TaxID=190310 RepID=A0ABQ4P6D6_9GAMM|nr:DUF1566 domain-containing protein [Shewanella sairae]MCL1130514.1 DUF1566 domain-containing protein [Shewanella sairae]GIU42973.1 hypothetical protein TUM4438_10810 [Shewanella sairae]